MKRRILVIATHPVQYQAPWFRDLTAHTDIEISVAFLDLPDADRQGVGFDVRFSWDVPLTEGYQWLKFESHISRRNRGFGFFGRRLINARKQISALMPDAVLIMGWHQFGLMQAWFAARSLGLPVIVRGESNAKRVRSRWVRIIHAFMLRHAHAFVAIGESNAEFYFNNGVPREQVFMGPYFVDNDFFASRASALERESVRARFGIGDGTVCVLFAGKFEPKKRPGDLLDAVGVLPMEVRRRVQILMVGSGPLEGSLRARSEPKSVTWTGFLNQTEIPAAYCAADVLVLPSDTGETWGLVVNEAMACGIPAIVSDQVGCAGDLVIHEVTGLVFPMGDIDSLSRMIARLVMDCALRQRLGAAARVRVTSRYTAEGSTSALAAAAEFVLQPRKQKEASS